MRSNRKRVAGLLRFFKNTGRGLMSRKEVLDGMTDEEILEMLRLIPGKGHLVHELVSYVNISPKSSTEVTKEDLMELRELLLVSEVMDS